MGDKYVKGNKLYETNKHNMTIKKQLQKIKSVFLSHVAFISGMQTRREMILVCYPDKSTLLLRPSNITTKYFLVALSFGPRYTHHLLRTLIRWSINILPNHVHFWLRASIKPVFLTTTFEMGCCQKANKK